MSVSSVNLSKEDRMRTAIATCAFIAAVVAAPMAEDTKSAFITTSTLVKFIDAHSR
jgi:hypothetical protein